MSALWRVPFIYLLTAVRKQGFHNPNRFSREPCEYILTFLSQALQFLTLFKKTRRALFTPCTSFVLFQCIELSKTNLLLSCPSILITTRSSAALLAAQNHSVKPSCCITTWNITMARNSPQRQTAAPQGASRLGPLRNSLVPLVWMAQREGAPFLHPCVSYSSVCHLFQIKWQRKSF